MPIKDYLKKLAPPGDLPEGIIKWQGPASYTQVTVGPPITGGDSVPSSLFGIQDIISIEFVGTYSGNFLVVPIKISGQKWVLMWRALKTATIGGQSQTQGTEAAASTNLSGEFVQLRLVTRSA